MFFSDALLVTLACPFETNVLKSSPEAVIAKLISSRDATQSDVNEVRQLRLVLKCASK